MKILINKTDNEVVLGGNYDFEKHSDCTIVRQDGVREYAIFHIRPDDLEVVEVAEMPSDLAPYTYLYIDGQLQPKE